MGVGGWACAPLRGKWKRLDPWLHLKGKKGLTTRRPILPRFTSVTTHPMPTTNTHTSPHLSKMKNPPFSSNVQPNIISTPLQKIESYLGERRTRFAICFQISFLRELYFPSTSDKIITRSIRFLATTRSTHILFTRAPRCVGQFSTTQAAADRNLNTAGLL